MRLALTLLLLLTATTSCQDSRPPTNLPVKRATFAEERERTLNDILQAFPSMGRDAGLHDFDGSIAGYSRHQIGIRIQNNQNAKRRLDGYKPETLTEDEKHDRALLLREVEYELFVDEEDLWSRLPQLYEELFSVNVYLDRDYAPFADRVRRLAQHEERALEAVPHVKKNLKSPLARPVVEAAIRNFDGYAEYLKNDVPKMIEPLQDAGLKARFTRANTQLAAAAADIAAFLRAELPKATASPALGRAAFERLLKAQEGLTTPIEELMKMGEEDLAKNKRALEELGKVQDERPGANDVVNTASAIVDESRTFIQEKKIVSIPTDDRCVVKETPIFKRWNFAFMDSPGPFESAANLSAFYYVTPPDPSWPAEQRATYVPFRGALRATTVHEVYPGHFLQSLFTKRAPTKVQKILTSYSFNEGWAHYVEQMMVEEGFGGGTPAVRAGQLREALLRNCRFVAAFGMHTSGLTVEQAEKRFIDDCKTDPAPAHQQALRGTFDPGYFAYTLGKLQILALRDEAKKKLGQRFSLQRFHDALLAHGNPPIALVRDRVLRDLDREGTTTAP